MNKGALEAHQAAAWNVGAAHTQFEVKTCQLVHTATVAGAHVASHVINSQSVQLARSATSTLLSEFHVQLASNVLFVNVVVDEAVALLASYACTVLQISVSTTTLLQPFCKVQVKLAVTSSYSYAVAPRCWTKDSFHSFSLLVDCCFVSRHYYLL